MEKEKNALICTRYDRSIKTVDAALNVSMEGDRYTIKTVQGTMFRIVSPPLTVQSAYLDSRSASRYEQYQINLIERKEISAIQKAHQTRWFNSLKGLEDRIIKKVKACGSMSKRRSHIEHIVRSRAPCSIRCRRKMRSDCSKISIIDENTGVVLNETDLKTVFTKTGDVVAVECSPYFYDFKGKMGIGLRLNEVYLLRSSLKRKR